MDASEKDHAHSIDDAAATAARLAERSAALCAHAARLIEAAAASMLRASEGTQHRASLIVEASRHRAELRELMTTFGRELRGAGVPRVAALERIRAAARSRETPVSIEGEMMAHDARRWAIDAFDAAA